MKRTYVKDKLKNIYGFTLLEVLVVIVLLSILAGILYPYVSGIESKAKATTMKENYHQIKMISGAAHALQAMTGNYSKGVSSNITIDDKVINAGFDFAYLNLNGMKDVVDSLLINKGIKTSLSYDSTALAIYFNNALTNTAAVAGVDRIPAVDPVPAHTEKDATTGANIEVPATPGSAEVPAIPAQDAVFKTTCGIIYYPATSAGDAPSITIDTSGCTDV